MLLVLAGFGLLGGQAWARWFTIVVVAVNFFAQLGFLGNSQYPLWALTALALNVVVLYALTVRWGESEADLAASPLGGTLWRPSRAAARDGLCTTSRPTDRRPSSRRDSLAPMSALHHTVRTVTPFHDRSRHSRLLKIALWLVGIAVVLVICHLAGFDVLDWFAEPLGHDEGDLARLHRRRASSSRRSRRR